MTTPDETRAVHADLGALRGLRRVFAGNHAELAQQLTVRDDPGKWLPLASDRGRGQLVLDNLDRLLFNYLSSAYSLSTSVWEICDKRGGIAAFPDYIEVSPWGKPGLLGFEFVLRNVVQHQRVTVTTQTIKFRRESTDDPLMGGMDFTLSMEQLRALDYGSARARQYVSSLAADLTLTEIIDTFTPALLGFVDWFISGLASAFGV